MPALPATLDAPADRLKPLAWCALPQFPPANRRFYVDSHAGGQ